MNYIEGSSREQALLFPEVIEEYIAENNSVRFIDAFVGELDLRGMEFTHTQDEVMGRWEDEHLLDEMEKRVKAHPEKMKLRKCLSEHPFGTIKRSMAAGYFLMKGLDKVRTEMSLSVLAYNLKRAINILGVKTMMEALA